MNVIYVMAFFVGFGIAAIPGLIGILIIAIEMYQGRKNLNRSRANLSADRERKNERHHD